MATMTATLLVRCLLAVLVKYFPVPNFRRSKCYFAVRVVDFPVPVMS